jgi:Fe-S-cluster-containing dehydrogenase component
MDQNDIDITGGQPPLRRVAEVDGSTVCTYISTACMHCSDAPCIEACPEDCIAKDPETGLTLYDSTDCVGCRSCAKACPFDAPVFGPDRKMRKCSGCIERVHHGMNPACTSACPTDALNFHRE